MSLDKKYILLLLWRNSCLHACVHNFQITSVAKRFKFSFFLYFLPHLTHSIVWAWDYNLVLKEWVRERKKKVLYSHYCLCNINIILLFWMHNSLEVWMDMKRKKSSLKRREWNRDDACAFFHCIYSLGKFHHHQQLLKCGIVVRQYVLKCSIRMSVVVMKWRNVVI